MVLQRQKLADHWTVIRVPALEVNSDTVLKRAWKEAEKPVQAAVERLIAQCEGGKTPKQFKDECFGPSPKDRDGALAFYRNGKPPNANYADPAKCSWLRPRYTKDLKLGIHAVEESKDGGFTSEDEEETDEEADTATSSDPLAEDSYGRESGRKWFCEAGALFLGGVNANDVIQGKVGDCWLLSGMSVLATRADLLERVFWRSTNKSMERKMRKYGFRVCRFFKDNAWFFVIIDDLLPVFTKSGKPVFAHCKDSNELWVPLLEKAYAKLHRSYDALIGGYVDGALRDLTGYACQELVLREGHTGFHPKNKRDLEDGSLWRMMDEYLNKWACMMGCSIQPDPQGAGQGSVETKIGDTGLMMRHAYSLIDVGTIQTSSGPVRLLRLRNPWGFGEWTGSWSDDSAEFRTYKAQLEKEFSGPVSKRKGVDSTAQTVEANDKDGTFFMAWEDWARYFTVVFAALDFPEHWAGLKLAGQWTKSTSGGNNTMKTWMTNPAHRFRVLEDSTRVFISLCQDDPRIADGKDQFKFQDPIGFHIAADPLGGSLPEHPPDLIPGSSSKLGGPQGIAQAPYKMHLSVDLDIPTMAKGNYVCVPSIYYDKRDGPYFLHLYSDKPIALEGGSLIAEEEEDNGKYVFVDFSAAPAPKPATKTQLSSFRAFEQHKEELKAQLATQRHTVADLVAVLRPALASKAQAATWDQWQVALAKLGLQPSRDAFAVFSGGDGLLDKAELDKLAEAEVAENQLFGAAEGSEGGGDEAMPDSSVGAGAGGPLGSRAKPAAGQAVVARMLAGAVRELQHENDTLASELDAVRKEQARMMHVLLLYGKMLKCYEGPVHGADELVKPTAPRPTRSRIPEDLLDSLLGSVHGEQAASSRPARRCSEHMLSFLETAGDEFMAVKPWKGAIVPPSKPPAPSPLGGVEPKLDWAFGRNCARGALRESVKGHALYPAAGLGVVFDVDAHKQVFFRGHTDDVICIDVNASGTQAVTGQVGKSPFACVWDTTSGELVAKLDKFSHQRAVSQVAFSTDGSQVMTVGADDSHSVAIYEAASGKLLGSAKGNKEVCLFAVHSGQRFVTGGVRYAAFLDPAEPNKKGKPGRFGKAAGGSAQTLPCAAALVGIGGEFLVTGAESGALLIWDAAERRCTTAVGADAHGGSPVDALCFDAASKTLTSGSKSGDLVVWSVGSGAALERTRAVKHGAPIRAVTVSFASLANGDLLRSETVVAGSHFAGELWGLTAVGSQGKLASVGDDAVVKLWCSTERKELRSAKLAMGPARAVACSPDGATLAVAGPDNVVALLDAETLETKAVTAPAGAKAASEGSKNPAKTGKTRAAKSREGKAATCIAFSPNGALLAVGSNDTNVYILDTASLKKKAVLKSSSGTVTHVDWSADSKVIRTNDTSYELLFYDVTAKKQLTSATALRDVEWATTNCSLTWETEGVWPPDADGTDVNAVVACGHRMLASGDDSGAVCLYPYPCAVRDESAMRKGLGHSSHVTNVAFLGDKALVSAGGNDRTVLHWSLSS